MSNQFTAEQGILLDEYLKGYIKAEAYFEAAGQIAAMLYKVQRDGLQIVLDAHKMQMEGGKVRFQMTMEDSVYELGRMFTFLKELAFGCVFAREEEALKVSGFLRFLDDGTSCASLLDAASYCTQQTGQQFLPQEQAGDRYMQPGAVRKQDRADDRYMQGSMQERADDRYMQGSIQAQQETISSPYIQQGAVRGNAAGPYAPRGGARTPSGPSSGQRAVPQGGMGVPPEQAAGRQMQQPADGETGVLGAGFWENLEQQMQQEGPQNGETGVLDPAFWEKALTNTPSVRLDAPGQGNAVYGRLVRTKDGKVTPITRDNFWIGKEGVDLTINKDVISRRHALIVCKDSHFFVSDNGSTNKTYVNNREIPARASVEIFNGTKIKFANEEYELQV